MPIDDRTSTQNYPKPNIANTLADDVGRLRTALDDIDTGMASKAPAASPVFTGTAGVPLGSASAPSLYFTGDPNTGLSSPGADQVAISTGGTGRLLVDSGGIFESYGGVYRLYRYASAPVFICRAAEGTQTSPSAITTSFTVGQYNFSGYDGSAYRLTSQIVSVSDGAISSTSSPGYLAFYTTPSASVTPLERLRVTSDGKVGIGTSSPQRRLHVQGVANKDYTNNPGLLSLTDTDSFAAGVGGGIHFGGAYTSGGAVADFAFLSGIKENATDGNYAGALVLGTRPNGSGGGSMERLRIDSAGTTTLTSTASTAPFIAKISTSEVARLDSSGRLLVGTSTARSNILGIGGLFQQEGANNDGARALSVVYGKADGGDPLILLGKHRSNSIGGNTIVSSGDGLGQLVYTGSDGTNFISAATVKAEVDGTPGTNDMPGRLVFSTTADGASSPTERMRINNNGTVGTLFGSAASQYISTTVTAGTAEYLLVGRHSATTMYSGTNAFLVTSNGNVTNANNSYGAISDVKLKENIVDAGSQWSDLKALQIRKYNFKEGQTHTQIGLVAQEVELVSPGLVTESPDRDEDGNDLGTITKSVNYSVLYMKAVKALQEAMERIEALEAKVATLEGV